MPFEGARPGVQHCKYADPPAEKVRIGAQARQRLERRLKEHRRDQAPLGVGRRDG
jgi:hypothetical protein